MEKLVSTKTMEAIDSKAQKSGHPPYFNGTGGVRAWRAFIAKDLSSGKIVRSPLLLEGK